MRRLLTILGLLVGAAIQGQTISYFNQGFLRQPSAAADLAYLGLSSSGIPSYYLTNHQSGLVVTGAFTGTFYSTLNGILNCDGNTFGTVTIGSGLTYVGGTLSATAGGGTVTTFSSGNFSPLFNTTVVNPGTTPAQSFSAINQSANLVFVGPASGGAAAPTFRLLVPADLGSFSNHNDVIPTTLNAGDVFAWSGTAWTNGAQGGSANSITVTNAGNTSFSLINDSNQPAFKFKSLSAGANVTLTDQGTNVVIDSAASGGGGSSTNFDLNFFDDNLYVVDEEFDQWRGTGSGQFTRGSGWAVTTVGGGGGVNNVNSNVPPYYGLIEIQGSTTPGNAVFVSQSSSSGISIYQNLSRQTNWLFHGTFFLHVTNTASIYRFGLADGINSAVGPAQTPSNCCGVRWNLAVNDANHFVFECRSNAVSVTNHSSVIVAIDTAYKISIWSLTNGVTLFSINGETPVAITNMPNQSLSMNAYVGIASGATANRMWVDRMGFRATQLGR